MHTIAINDQASWLPFCASSASKQAATRPPRPSSSAMPTGRGDDPRRRRVCSQLDEHSAYGGVVPEIAARAHVEALDTADRRSAAAAPMLSLADVDAIAATSGPGLIGGLHRRPDDRQGDRQGRRQAALCRSTTSKAMR